MQWNDITVSPAAATLSGVKVVNGVLILLSIGVNFNDDELDLTKHLWALLSVWEL